MEKLAKLYICSDEEEKASEIITFLDRIGVGYEKRLKGDDVVHAAGIEGVEGDFENTRLPLIVWPNGEVLENCTKESLVNFLHDRGVEFEDS